MDRTRSGGLRGSMPSLMKHRHAPVGERRTCLLRHIIGAKVYGAIDDWLPTIRRPARAVAPTHRQKLRTSATLWAVRSARQADSRRHPIWIGGTVTHAEISR